MFQSPSEMMLVAQHLAPVSSTTGSYGITGTAVNLAGWDGCMFIIEIGAMAASGTFDAKAQSAAASAFSTAHDITSGALTQLAAASDASNCYVIDVRTETVINAQSGDQYLRLAMQTDGTHSVLVGVTSVLYRATGSLPPTAPRQLVKV